MRGVDPAGQSVGNVTSIAQRAAALAQVAARVDAAAIVRARRAVEARDVCAGLLGQQLLQAVARRRPGRAVLDHLGDLGCGAGSLDCAVVDDAGEAEGGVVGVAGACAVVRLHEAGVEVGVLRCDDADTACRFLHDDSLG